MDKSERVLEAMGLVPTGEALERELDLFRDTEFLTEQQIAAAEASWDAVTSGRSAVFFADKCGDSSNKWIPCVEAIRHNSGKKQRKPGLARQVLVRMAVCLCGTLLLITTVICWTWTRDPYVIRTAKKAEAAFNHEEWDESLELINVALQSEPNNLALVVARARLHLARREMREAKEDFEEALHLSTDGYVLAQLAYCLCLSGDEIERALALNQEAQELGFETAGLLNNIGYCYLRLGETKRAKEVLQQAIDLDNDLQVAFAHLALLELQSAATESRTPDPRYIESAVKLAPSYRQLYERLALTYAVSLRNAPPSAQIDRSELQKRIIGAVKDAVQLGASGSSLTNRLCVVLPELWEDDGFRSIFDMRGSESSHSRQSLPYVVDPSGVHSIFLSSPR